MSSRSRSTPRSYSSSTSTPTTSTPTTTTSLARTSTTCTSSARTSTTRTSTSGKSTTSTFPTTATTVGSTAHSDEFTDHRVVSVVYANGKIGASFYTQEFLDVRMVTQFPDQGNLLRQLEQLLIELQPKTIIISRTAHRDLVRSVDAFVNGRRDTRVEKVPPNQMQLDTAKQELQNLNLTDQRGVSFLDLSQEEKMIHLNSILDFRQEVSLRSLGALLQYVKTHFQDAENVVIASLGMNRDCGHLYVSAGTLRDLHIISEEFHPCSLQGSVRENREGSSVFSLFERNCTIGRTRLKSMFAAPLNEAEKITKSLDSIDYLVSQREYSLALQKALSKVKRIDRILVRMHECHTTVPEWRILRDLSQNLVAIQDLLASAPNASMCHVIHEARENSCKDFVEVLNLIDKVIDFEAFEEKSAFTTPIRAGICEYLDEKKKQLFGGIQRKLTRLTLREMNDMPATVSDGRIIYMPCWGFLFATDLENEEAMGRVRHAELICRMDTAMLFKTTVTRELDEEYGDLRNVIVHREGKICRTLQKEVLKRTGNYLDNIHKLCNLDAVLALAITARDQGFTRPNLTDHKIIEIKNGYHPLLAFSRASQRIHIKANSFRSSEDMFVAVVTGANSSGKSVYLRQNALVVFLAHVGSFVPAEWCKIRLLDTIQTSFFINESLHDQASSFAIQCRQIASIERNIENSRALVVIDEFGKGTKTADGAGLCVALLEKFLAESSIPHVLFATHYNKHLYYFLRNRPKAVFLTFRYYIERDKFVQLYEIEEGVSLRSFANSVAKEADLPAEIVAAQERISEALEHHHAFEIPSSEGKRGVLRFIRQAIEDVKSSVEYYRSLSTRSSTE